VHGAVGQIVAGAGGSFLDVGGEDRQGVERGGECRLVRLIAGTNPQGAQRVGDGEAVARVQFDLHA
jgi:hypothetical protein